ncbi:MAG: hypothetical protein K0R39_3495 [Symbiobacteriaceae bacterium]|jgi:hypothetical protein|nr:hypothetical protein [Symbiobacteriaceae bacterium]
MPAARQTCYAGTVAITERVSGVNFQHISGDLAAVIVAQVKAGKSLQQIARDMHISVDVAQAALHKWSWVSRPAPATQN